MRILAVTIFIVCCAGYAFADDFEPGRKTGLAGGVLLSSPSPSDLIACPAAVYTNDRFIVETGFQRKYELSDLDEVFAVTGYGYKNMLLVIGFSQLGRSNYYVEQMIRGSLSYKYNAVTLSLITSSKRLEIGADEKKFSLSAFGLGAAAGMHYKEYHLGFVYHNINRPKLDENVEAERRRFNIFAEIEGFADFSITGRISFEENETPIYSIGQYFNMTGGHGIFWGIQSDPVSYGGGVDISYADFSISYAVSNHPTLGFTHNISINYGFGGEEEERK